MQRSVYYAAVRAGKKTLIVIAADIANGAGVVIACRNVDGGGAYRRVAATALLLLNGFETTHGRRNSRRGRHDQSAASIGALRAVVGGSSRRRRRRDGATSEAERQRDEHATDDALKARTARLLATSVARIRALPIHRRQPRLRDRLQIAA